MIPISSTLVEQLNYFKAEVFPAGDLMSQWFLFDNSLACGISGY